MVNEAEAAEQARRDELVDARFIPDDQTSEFSINTQVEQAEDFTGKIQFGSILRMRRGEAEDRQDFQIVGEEDTTTSPLANPQALVRAQEVPGERSVVAPPPAPLSSATAPVGDAPAEEN